MAVSVPLSPAPQSVRSLTIVRHASTAWSKSGQHTGRTDIPLDEDGRAAAHALGLALAAAGAERAFASPLARARETCRLSGLDRCALDDDLMEWDYGEYEGLTTAEIRCSRPGWDLFADGCPGGEDASAVGGRADAFLATLGRSGSGSVVAFAHGHFLRVLIARWLGLPPECGRSFLLAAPSISTLTWEHENPVIAHLNE